jgi:tetratricopeptide (TPR) repeat protein
MMEDSTSAGNAESSNNLAYMYRQSKQYGEAVTSAKRALAIKPYLEEARLNLWNAYREGGESDSAYQSIVAYKGSHPLSARENFIYAIICSDLQKFDESLATLRKVLAQINSTGQPRYEDITGTTFSGVSYNSDVFKGKVLYNMGYVFGATNKTDSALVYLRQAVEANPNLVEGWINLGSANYAKQDYVEAKAAYLKAARLNPKNVLLIYNLALVSLATADTSSARGYLQQCLAIDAGFAPARSLGAAIGNLR